jgi:hypothetical protein
MVVATRRIRWAEHVARDIRNAHEVLIGEPEGKRSLSSPRVDGRMF